MLKRMIDLKMKLFFDILNSEYFPDRIRLKLNLKNLDFERDLQEKPLKRKLCL